MSEFRGDPKSESNPMRQRRSGAAAGLALWREEAHYTLAKGLSVFTGFFLSITVYHVDFGLSQAILLFDGLRAGIAPLDLAILRSSRRLERLRLTASKGLLYVLAVGVVLLFYPDIRSLGLILGYALLQFLASQYAAHAFRIRHPLASTWRSVLRAPAHLTWPLAGLSALGPLCLASIVVNFAYFTVYVHVGSNPSVFYAMRALDFVLLVQAMSAQRVLAYGRIVGRTVLFIGIGSLGMGLVALFEPFIGAWGLLRLLSMYACSLAFVMGRLKLILVNQLFLAAAYFLSVSLAGPGGVVWILPAEAVSLASFALTLRPWRKRASLTIS